MAHQIYPRSHPLHHSRMRLGYICSYGTGIHSVHMATVLKRSTSRRLGSVNINVFVSHAFDPFD